MLCTYCNKPVVIQVKARETINYRYHNIMCSSCSAKQDELRAAEKDNSVSYSVNFLTLLFFPLGILMYVVWKEKRPRAAKYALTFAMIPIIFYLSMDYLL